jgi:hypothetical protein
VKKRVVSLVTACILSVAGVAGAAADPFGDVPADHWAYCAVSQLVKDGVIEGDGNGTFNGGRTLTRYEIAMVVTRAMAKMDKANAEDAALIRKMVSEFANELNNLGVRVSDVEKKSNKLDIYSLGFIKYDYHDHGAAAPYFERGFKYILGFNHNVDGNFVMTAENEYIRPIDIGPGLVQNELKQLNIHGNIGATNIVLGKYIHFDALFDGEIMGAKVTAGDKVKTSLLYGRLYGNSGPNSATATNPLYDNSSITPTYLGTEMNYQLNKDTTVNASYTQASYDGYDTARYALVGADTKLSRDVALKAFYGKSNYDTQNKTYGLGLQYKNAIPPIVGSSDTWLRYVNVDTYSVIKSGYFGWAQPHGAKGIQIGYDFVPVKNTILSLEINRMKATDGSDWQDNFYRVQLGLFLF